MKTTYISKRFTTQSLQTIETANNIIAEYSAQGFDLTLRQLYYQFVARGVIPNNERQYKRLGNLVSDARLAGLIDWACIVDRTRVVRRQSTWNSPADIIASCASQYRIDKWQFQAWRPFVWVEKEALAGILRPVCEKWNVPYLACRGYVSQSAMYRTALEMLTVSTAGQKPIILYLGDHDPSGIDMTRDVLERQHLFEGAEKVVRLALNMDQVEELAPPPNPAKVSDSRASEYIARYGPESWELDALEPTYIARLIEEAVLGYMERDLFEAAIRREAEQRRQLKMAATSWEAIVDSLNTEGEGGEGTE